MRKVMASGVYFAITICLFSTYSMLDIIVS